MPKRAASGVSPARKRRTAQSSPELPTPSSVAVGAPSNNRTKTPAQKMHKLRQKSIKCLFGHARRHSERYNDEVLIIMRSAVYKGCVRFYTNSEALLNHVMPEKYQIESTATSDQRTDLCGSIKEPRPTPSSVVEPVVRRRSIFDAQA